MYLILENVLDAATIASIRADLKNVPFSDGSATAGWHGRGGKNNLQATHAPSAQKIYQALGRHKNFRAATQANVIVPATFSRYDPGMSYGPHVDDAIMGQQAVRTDIAMTLFLGDPSSYDGGELVIETYTGPVKFKLAAGDALLYPAATLHHVTEVTKGQRLVAILWVQSLIRDPAKREILFDLETLRKSLREKSGDVKTPESELAAKTFVNLMRLWAEP